MDETTCAWIPRQQRARGVYGGKVAARGRRDRGKLSADIDVAARDRERDGDVVCIWIPGQQRARGVYGGQPVTRGRRDRGKESADIDVTARDR